MITKDLRGHEPTEQAADTGERRLPRPGDVVGKRYRIDAHLGQGGFGAVYRARDTVLGRDIALKVLGRGTDEPVAVARFLQEARAAAQLASDHVAIVHEAGVSEAEAPYIVMELLRGRDLHDELAARGRLPVAEAVELVLQAMLGLAHAHARSIVHRDLKPRNLFLARRDDGTAVVKVLDFGIAKADASSLTQTGATLGTPRYMAPEQLRSARAVDARTDIWALGVVIYELTTAAAIFDAESSVELAAQIVADPHVPLRVRVPELPEALERVVDRCLDKEPARRYRDLAALAAALAPFAPGAAPLVSRIETALGGGASSGGSGPPAAATAHEPTAAAPTRTVPAGPSSPEPAAPRRPSSRIWMILSIAIGIAGVAFGIAMWMRTPPAGDREARGPAADAAASGAGSAPSRDAAVAATEARTSVVPADAAIAASGAPPADAAIPASGARAAPSAGRPVAARRPAARPSPEEVAAIQERCTSGARTAPTFLIPGNDGPASLQCGRLAALGCAEIARRCEAVPVDADERRRCRDFLGRLASAEVCR